MAGERWEGAKDKLKNDVVYCELVNKKTGKRYLGIFNKVNSSAYDAIELPFNFNNEDLTDEQIKKLAGLATSQIQRFAIEAAAKNARNLKGIKSNFADEVYNGMHLPRLRGVGEITTTESPFSDRTLIIEIRRTRSLLKSNMPATELVSEMSEAAKSYFKDWEITPYVGSSR